MAAPRITVLQLDPHVPLDRFSGWLLGAVLRNVPVWRQPLPSSDALGHGVVVLGGLASVDDREPWMRPLKHLIIDVVDRGIPLLAICLGHHLLAQAFGGQSRVADPAGGEHGPIDVQWRPAARNDPVLGRVVNLRGTLFPSSHDDAVVRLPAGAVELARSPAYAHQAFRIGSAVGVQFHPEASPELMTAWEEMQHRDPIAMRRRMRLVDAETSRNGALVAQGFVRATREHAECALSAPGGHS